VSGVVSMKPASRCVTAAHRGSSSDICQQLVVLNREECQLWQNVDGIHKVQQVALVRRRVMRVTKCRTRMFAAAGSATSNRVRLRREAEVSL